MDAQIYPKLTCEQNQVATHKSGHAKVVACPGSGKTETMLYRVHYLLSHGVDPTRLMVVMFNRAAKEGFDRRLKSVCSEFIKLPEIRTFHSLGLTISKRLVNAGLLSPATLITDEGVVIQMCRQAIRSADPEPAPHLLNDPDTLEAFKQFVDIVKSGLAAPAVVFDELGLRADYKFFLDAFDKLEQQRKRNKQRTFADLIYDPVKLLVRSPEAVALIKDRFQNIIVDEYQDTSAIQQEMIKIIAGTRADVMVIGDLDQCIYEFRGAKPEFIRTGFERDFPSVQRYTLSRTFRYGPRLAITSNYLISKNKERDLTLCVSAPSTPDTKVFVTEESANPQQGFNLAPFIQSWTASKRKHAEIAILPRLFADAYAPELQLLSVGIPYRLVGAPSILESKITQAILGFFHLSCGSLAGHPRAQQLVDGMMTMPPVGARQDEMRELMMDIQRDPSRAPAKLKCASTLAQGIAQKKLRERASLFILFHALTPETPAHVAIREWARESGASQWWAKSATAEQQDEKEKVFSAWLALASDRNLTVRSFLQTFADMEAAHDRMENTEDAVLITSLHRAKGSEWPVVIMPGLQEGNFPFVPSDRPSGVAEMEGERRLFYVGITRAREQLYLLHPKDEVLNVCMRDGLDQAPANCIASRFLYEMNQSFSGAAATLVTGGSITLRSTPSPDIANAYFRELGMPEHAQKLTVSTPPPGAAASQPFENHSLTRDLLGPETIDVGGLNLRRGGQVNHPRFGTGVLKSFEMDGRQAVISFPLPTGERTLNLAAAVEAGLRPSPQSFQ